MTEVMGKGSWWEKWDPGGFCQAVHGSNPGINSTCPSCLLQRPRSSTTFQLQSWSKGSAELSGPGLRALAAKLRRNASRSGKPGREMLISWN